MIKIDNKLILMCLFFIILGVVTNTLIVDEHPSIVFEKTNSSDEGVTIDIGGIYMDDDDSDLNVSEDKSKKKNLLNKTG